MPNKSTQGKLACGYILIALCVLIAGCVTMYNPATGRKETLFISTQEEVKLGADMDRQLRQKTKMINDRRMQDRVNTIGSRLAMYSDRQDLHYHFAVVDDKELNAFAIPGGYVYINKGLMEQANDDELAGVMAHEIGHIAAKHSVKQLQGQLGLQLIMSIILGGSESAANTEQALNVVSNLVNLGYSRSDEYLADKLAVRYTRRAGYSPIGIVTFFKKLEAQGGTAMHLVFLSSHPATSERIKRVEQEMQINPF